MTIAEEHPDAEVITYGDESLGITIGGKEWAAEIPHKKYRALLGLNLLIWQYCRLAMGVGGDTYARQ